MRQKIFTTILLAFASHFAFSQEIELTGFYSLETHDWFKSCVGTEISYNQFFGNNKVGISVKELTNNKQYKRVEYDESDGVSFLVRNIKPNNKRFSLKLNYSHDFLSSETTSLFIGGFISLNYMIIDQDGSANHYIGNWNSDTYTCRKGYYIIQDVNQNIFRPGCGLNVEYEIKFEHFSTSLKLSPEFIYVDNHLFWDGDWIDDSPSLIFGINTGVSIKYRFK